MFFFFFFFIHQRIVDMQQYKWTCLKAYIEKNIKIQAD